jgi:glutamate carboxypeptidase
MSDNDRTFAGVDAAAVLSRVRDHEDAFVEFVTRLAEVESPTDDPSSQAPVQDLLVEAFESLGMGVRHVPGRATGGHLLARPENRVGGRPLQLLVGHCDTVWPVGTLAEMPVRLEDGRLAGPGTFDMKAGLTQIVFALKVLRDLGLEPPATPVVLVNSDEEIGSPESGRLVRRLAPRACRAFVPEPSMGPEGRFKTTRKGVGNYHVTVTGKAAHAGLNPDGGASAIQELAHVVQALHAMSEGGSGTTVNVGVVRGGTRPNVIAAEARAEVDVRVVTAEAGRAVEKAILGLESATPGVSLSVSGGMHIPPLERTARNRKLWEQARAAASALGMELGEAVVGGASDGSVISQYTATLDGMGAVGDGAHALHEHIVVDATVDRCALLALLLMAPVDDDAL